MSCKAYKNALTEAAANGLEPQAGLQIHLRECSACHAEFTEAQSLFAAVDSGMSAVANTQPPPSFLPRVRLLIGQEPAPKLGWTSLWATTAVAVSIFAVMIFTLSHGGKRPQQQTLQISNVQQSQSQEHTGSQSIGQSRKSTIGANVSVPSLRQRKAFKSTRNTAQQPEVLVPATEREGYLHFVSALQRPEVVLAFKSPQNKEELLKVEPVQFAQLNVPPLDSSKD